MEFDGVDAIQQVLAEVSFVHQPTDVCIGGADEPHINGRSLRTSQTTDTTLFDGSQQFGLHGQGKVTYLVQKKRTAGCHFHTSNFRFPCIGEGAFLVAEQLAFEQLFGNTAEVYRDKRLSIAGRIAVKHTGNHILSGSILT